MKEKIRRAVLAAGLSCVLAMAAGAVLPADEAGTEGVPVTETSAGAASSVEPAAPGGAQTDQTGEESLLITDADPAAGEGETAAQIETEEAAKTASETQRTVNVTSSFSETEMPDMAEVTFDVTTEGTDAREAADGNSESVAKVMAALAEAGVAEESIRTNYSISPRYDYSRDTPQLTGFTADTGFTVSDLKVEEVGSLIDACVEAGVNSFDGVRYTCSTYDEKYASALASAVKAARGKAQIIAEAAGHELGDVLTVTEGYQDTSYQYKSLGGTVEMASYSSADTASGVDIQPGMVEIDASVTVTYELK